MGTVAPARATGVRTQGQMVCSRAVSGCSRIVPRERRGRRAGGLAAAVSVALGLAACGSSSNGQGQQAAGQPSGNFPVQVRAASFPSAQTLSEHTHLVIAIRNAGSRTIPNVAVTVCPVTCAYPAPPGQGTSSAVLDSNLGQDSLDNPSPPVWVVEHPPGPCGFSCRGGGGGAYATQYPDTWASGPLKPGATVKFDWGVASVQAGRHVVAWQVAGDLSGKAKAVLAGGGGQPHGRFVVNVSSAPAQAYVNNNGQIVSGSGANGG